MKNGALLRYEDMKDKSIFYYYYLSAQEEYFHVGFS
jgi:hypothetical protein